jgi:hypothetical protein
MVVFVRVRFVLPESEANRDACYTFNSQSTGSNLNMSPWYAVGKSHGRIISCLSHLVHLAS